MLLEAGQAAEREIAERERKAQAAAEAKRKERERAEAARRSEAKLENIVSGLHVSPLDIQIPLKHIMKSEDIDYIKPMAWKLTLDIIGNKTYYTCDRNEHEFYLDKLYELRNYISAELVNTYWAMVNLTHWNDVFNRFWWMIVEKRNETCSSGRALSDQWFNNTLSQLARLSREQWGD